MKPALSPNMALFVPVLALGLFLTGGLFSPIPCVAEAPASAAQAEAAAPAAVPPAAPTAKVTAKVAPKVAPEVAPEVADAPAGEAARKSPQETIDAYLLALQKHDFSGAYDYVASTMRAGKDREEWAKEQQYIVQMGEVKIFGFQTFEAVAVTEEGAKVPNILKSQDKFLNQLGLDEYELYELIVEDGTWRVDYQTLVEGAERTEYFPEQ